MKLLTNLDCMQPPLTGIGHYTKQLAAHLAGHPDVEALQGLYRSRWLDAAQLQDWPPTNTQALTRAGGSAVLRQRLRRIPGSYGLRHRLRTLRFASLTRSYADHVYWEPGLELMPFAGRRVATVYDLSHLAVRASHPPARIAYLRRQIDYTLRHADAIVTISRTMRREIAVYAGLQEADIAVAPPAAAAAFRPLEAATRDAVRQRLGLPPRYILSVGTLEPRKNLERLAQAYATLPGALRREWPLVCVGAKGWNDTSLSQELRRLEARGELLRLGYVAQQDLPLITASAGLMAYPSLYEGFGMPVVEAMACGVPVLTSRNTSMHEITGESAFLVEPGETESIRAVLETALEDAEARRRLGRQGIARAAYYDWQRSAEALLASLKGGAYGA